MTVRYRCLIDPALGTGIGNTVYVGMDAAYGNQLALVTFEGLPKRTEQVRELLDGVIRIDGYRFSLKHPSTPRSLDAAMRGHDMQRFSPELVDGADILERDEPVH